MRFVCSVFLMVLLCGCSTVEVTSPVEKIEIQNVGSQQAQKFLQKAKKQIGVVKTYDFSNGYYGNGGYPPEDTGVCTDVIWRAYRDMGLDFKSSIIAHYKDNPSLYTNFGDSNISFRRVKNMYKYFNKTAKKLTINMEPGNKNNLIKWQAGDIVMFEALPPKNLWHIGVISDNRKKNGVPYMIDNHGYGVGETITPLEWNAKIIGHYRVF